MTARLPPRIATAGWSIPANVRDRFPPGASVLERYARRLNAVEINSSFYRPHQRTTYTRWAATTPEGFRFAVKIPRTITHERRLRDADDLIATFAEQAAGLGGKLGALLVQLPPSLAFDAEAARRSFDALATALPAPIACEPRHPTWFTPEAEALLREARVARVAADPPPAPGADRPGGWRGLTYRRLHGAPRIYWSDYDADALDRIAGDLATDAATGVEAWCVFDNTASGAALPNALAVMERL